MALVEAAKILRSISIRSSLTANPARKRRRTAVLRNMLEATGYAPVDLELEEKLSPSLAELNLSVRATNCLESGHQHGPRLGAADDDQLLQVRNFGETTLSDVKERLGDQPAAGMKLPQSMQQKSR